MSEAKLGSLVDETAERDAIHIAIAPVVAADKLYPGQEVGLNDKGEAVNSDTPVGIVDPFLKGPVFPPQRFYLCLFPQTVTGMRHHWQHPAFADAKPDVTASKAWIENMASQCGVSYDDVIDAATTGDYIHMGENERYKDVYWNNADEFWRHFEIVTGTSVHPEDRPSLFSCSC
jgi:hypothetical protein